MSKKKATCTSMVPKSVVRSFMGKEARHVRVKIAADSGDFIPTYKTKGAACCDLRANLQPDALGHKQLTIAPGYTELVDCGFSIQMPAGYETQIRARSGLAVKGIIVTNATEEAEGGTIDDDYRGRIKVILSNVGRQIVTLNHMDRIAQMSIRPVWYFDFLPVKELDSDTERDTQGFGSTGVQ
jgi:dUTP pyrophosphatase